jgi:hypothetical protein
MITLCACSPAEDSSTAPKSQSASQETQSQSSTPAPSAETAEEVSFTLYADFTAGYTGDDMSELLKTKEETATQTLDAFLLADRLSQWSGLDFTLNRAEISGEEAWIDWDASSTLVAGLGDREQKEDFHFFDAESLNWFMMDSLAQTLKENLPVNAVYYSQGGGDALTFAEMTGLTSLPVNEPYEGSAFYVAHSDNRGDGMDDVHNQYEDTENGFLLYYPNVFSPEGTYDSENGYMRFPSLQDDTALLYWVTPNTYDETSADLIDRMSLIEGKVLERDSDMVIGGVESMNQETGEWSFEIGYWWVRPDCIVCVMITGETQETAEYWYGALSAGAVHVERTSSSDSYSMTSAEAMDILSAAIADIFVEGTAIVETGEDEIDGLHAWKFSFGQNTPEKFTAEQHFAVDDNGQVWVLDILEDQYIPYAAG